MTGTDVGEALSETEPVPTEQPLRRDPLAVMWSRWLLSLALAVVGAVAGVAASTQHETMTTAEARLAVGSNSLKAFQVAGFATASEALAANYARFVAGSSTTTSALSGALGSRVVDVARVNASPIPDSNVIRIEVEAASPTVAVTAADAVAQDLVSQVNETAVPSSTVLLADYRGLAVKVAKANRELDSLTRRRGEIRNAGGDINTIQSRINRAEGKLQTQRLKLTAAGVRYQQTLTQPDVENTLVEVQEAAVTGSDARRTRQLYGVAGLLAGLLLALVVANLLGPPRRERRRLRPGATVPEEAAATRGPLNAVHDDERGPPPTSAASAAGLGVTTGRRGDS